MKGVTEEMVADWERKGLVAGQKRPAPDGFTLHTPTKYRNVKTEIDGFVFDSKKEARRWMDLRAEQADGTIRELRRQVEFPLCVNGHHVCTFVADFVYMRGKTWIVEDVKGKRTKDYIIKRKLFAAVMGFEIVET